MSDAGDDNQDPQSIVNDFWDNLISKEPSRVTTIFPKSLYANLLPPVRKQGLAKGRNAAESYEAAAADCRARVERIVRECHRTNEKFTDPDFDIEGDMGRGNCLNTLLTSLDDFIAAVENSGPVSSDALKDCLSTLSQSNILNSSVIDVHLAALSRVLNTEDSSPSRGPKAVHRVDWIFEKPSFTLDGYSSSDVRQGANGDCWFIAAVATLCSDEKLMERICVARDEECGVYGFVFHRDGEWFSTVVDDNLYLSSEDWDVAVDIYDATGERERKYRKNRQTGSEALYFAQCADPNEIWLPLLEKAYAKVHGDYKAIAGGFSGEGVEDLTGGVTTKLITSRILSKEILWQELLQVNKQFLFAASSPSLGSDADSRRGLALSHAYSVLKAVEEEDEDGTKVRLVLIRNPWGKRSWNGVGEWNGPWSDGSKEWTSYWLNKLNHKFGDDGMFWMSYDDLRSRFELLDRTRLFDNKWTVVQTWTSVSVSWVTGYLNIKFQVEIKKAGPTVFVLSQLDDRYFQGFEGQYYFDLHFLLQKQEAAPGDHIVRARGAWFGNRSISAEVDLEPGVYEILPKIVASRDESKPQVQDVVKEWAAKNPQKLRQIGMNYDIANAKGIVELSDEEKEAKKKREAEKKEMEEFRQWKKEKEEREKKEKENKGKGKVVEKETDVKPTEAPEVEKPKESSSKEEAGKEKAQPEAEKPKDSSSSATSGKKESKDQATKSDSEDESSEEESSTEKESSDSEAEEKPPSPEESVKQVTQTRPEPAAQGVSSEPSAPEADAETDEAKDNDDAKSQKSDGSEESEKKKKKRLGAWNAVCVIGLRVYAMDESVSIKLVKPKDPEEAASLDVDGVTAAGATM